MTTNLTTFMCGAIHVPVAGNCARRLDDSVSSPTGMDMRVGTAVIILQHGKEGTVAGTTSLAIIPALL